MTSRASIRRSPFTSAGCARRSSLIPTTRVISSPSAAAATCFASNFPWRRTSSRRCGASLPVRWAFSSPRGPFEAAPPAGETVPAPVPADYGRSAARPGRVALRRVLDRRREPRQVLERRGRSVVRHQCAALDGSRAHCGGSLGRIGATGEGGPGRSGVDARRAGDRSRRERILGITVKPFECETVVAIAADRTHCLRSSERAPRVRGQRFARAAHAACGDQADARNGARLGRRCRARARVLAAAWRARSTA